MGAFNVEVVTTLGSPQVAGQYDYVLVEDRDEKRELPAWARSTSNVCNIQWLKQCLVSDSWRKGDDKLLMSSGDGSGSKAWSVESFRIVIHIELL